MNLSRRDLIKKGGLILLGVLVFEGLTNHRRSQSQGLASPVAEGGPYDWGKHYWGFVVDTNKCIGCGRCVRACKLENRVPLEPEHHRTWVERYVITLEGEAYVDSPQGGINGFAGEAVNVKYQNLKIRNSFFVPKLCNQCDNPPCVQVCPVAATYRTKDGIILVDQQRCIGCRYCIQACPYGARYLLPSRPGVGPLGEGGVVDKCTWCYHRITRGVPPACVEACPVKARAFGDLRTPESPVRQILAEARINVLKPDLGTRPKVYYVGLDLEVR